MRNTNLSPTNTHNISTIPAREQIKWKLQIIFVYYTSYADRNNFKLLKQQNYRRYLIDSQTIKSQSSLVHYDIAFQKISHNAIIFKDFLKLIPEIAELLFKTQGRSQAFSSYIHRHIQPLYNEIIDKSQFGLDISLALNTQIDPKIQQRLLKIIVTQRAYNQYIRSPVNSKDPIVTFQCLINFLKDFQICPHIVSKSLVYIIFLSLMKDKNQGQIFNINDFVKILILIAQVSSRKYTNAQLCSNAKMIKLLQRMQISAGFDKVSKKILYETAISPSFLRSFNQKLQQDSCIQKMDKNISKLYASSTRHRNCNQGCEEHASGKKQRKDQLRQENYHTVQKIITAENRNMSKQFKEIKLAFQQLCQFGQVANSKTLKSYKLKKLFQRIGVTGMVTQAWLDIQIVNLQRGSQSGKIQFPQFLELLSLISKKIGSNFDQISNLILADRQINEKSAMESGGSASRKINQYTEQDQQLLKQIIQSCEKQAQKIYRKYTNDNPLLGFTEFSKMMYDFQIFPAIISKSKLYQIFSTLNDVRQEQSLPPRQKISKSKDVDNLLKDNKKIDFSGFLMGLIYVGQQICDQSLETCQKLIILLQKINESEGYKKICNISLVQNVRKKFTKFYIKNFHKEQQHVEDFDQLLNGLA